MINLFVSGKVADENRCPTKIVNYSSQQGTLFQIITCQSCLVGPVVDWGGDRLCYQMKLAWFRSGLVCKGLIEKPGYWVYTQ